MTVISVRRVGLSAVGTRMRLHLEVRMAVRDGDSRRRDAHERRGQQRSKARE